MCNHSLLLFKGSSLVCPFCDVFLDAPDGPVINPDSLRSPISISGLHGLNWFDVDYIGTQCLWQQCPSSASFEESVALSCIVESVCPNTLFPVHGYTISPPGLVLGYFSPTDLLSSRLQSNSPSVMDKILILQQVVAAIKSLHHLNLPHGGVSSDNIICNPRNKAFLANLTHSFALTSLDSKYYPLLPLSHLPDDKRGFFGDALSIVLLLHEIFGYKINLEGKTLDSIVTCPLRINFTKQVLPECAVSLTYMLRMNYVNSLSMLRAIETILHELASTRRPRVSTQSLEAMVSYSEQPHSQESSPQNYFCFSDLPRVDPVLVVDVQPAVVHKRPYSCVAREKPIKPQYTVESSNCNFTEVVTTLWKNSLFKSISNILFIFVSLFQLLYVATTTLSRLRLLFSGLNAIGSLFYFLLSSPPKNRHLRDKFISYHSFLLVYCSIAFFVLFSWTFLWVFVVFTFLSIIFAFVADNSHTTLTLISTLLVRKNMFVIAWYFLTIHLACTTFFLVENPYVLSYIWSSISLVFSVFLAATLNSQFLSFRILLVFNSILFSVLLVLSIFVLFTFSPSYSIISVTVSVLSFLFCSIMSILLRSVYKLEVDPYCKISESSSFIKELFSSFIFLLFGFFMVITSYFFQNTETGYYGFIVALLYCFSFLVLADVSMIGFSRRFLQIFILPIFYLWLFLFIFNLKTTFNPSTSLVITTYSVALLYLAVNSLYYMFYKNFTVSACVFSRGGFYNTRREYNILCSRPAFLISVSFPLIVSCYLLVVNEGLRFVFSFIPFIFSIISLGLTYTVHVESSGTFLGRSSKSLSTQFSCLSFLCMFCFYN
ncbi:hypothetical protein RCL1_001576 [Eukaryota sp. TZLM3-RCL]